jgi:NitT/TauT family transport system substrate-binding protein
MTTMNKPSLRTKGLIFLILSSLLFAGCAQASSSIGKSEKLKLTLADISSNPVFRVAKEKGFFEKYGIEAELVTFATPAEGVNALFIKQVDIAFGADFPLLNAVSKGPYSIFASTGTATDLSASDWKLFVRDDIKSGSDLKGRKLSFLRGTFLPYLWDVYLGEYGIALSDVTLIGQGGLDEAYVALRRGEIDGVWVYNSTNHQRFAALDNVKELTDMSKTPVRLGSGLIASDELLTKHRGKIIDFLKALDETSAWIQNNKEETADIMYEQVKAPKENTLQDLPKNPWKIGFTEKAYETLKGQKAYMVESGIIEKDFDLNDRLNLDLVREAFPDRVIDIE